METPPRPRWPAWVTRAPSPRRYYGWGLPGFFSTSGWLDVSLGRDRMAEFGEDARKIIKALGPEPLEAVALIRQKLEQLEVAIPCCYELPVEHRHSVMVPLTFDDGLEWIVQIRKKDSAIARRFVFNRACVWKFLRFKLGSLIPEVIEWSKSFMTDPCSEPFGKPFILMSRVNGERMSELLEEQVEPVRYGDSDSSLDSEQTYDRTEKDHRRLIRCLNELASATVRLGKTVHHEPVSLEWSNPNFHPRPGGRLRYGITRVPKGVTLDQLETPSGSREFFRGEARPKIEDLRILLRLIQRADSKCGRSDECPLQLRYQDVLIDPIDGHITAIISTASLVHSDAVTSIYAYPEELRDDLECDVPYWDDLCECFHPACKRDPMDWHKNALAQNHCDTLDYFRAVWKLCISHYAQSGSCRRPTVDDIARASPCKTWEDGDLSPPCRWDIVNLLDALWTGDRGHLECFRKPFEHIDFDLRIKEIEEYAKESHRKYPDAETLRDACEKEGVSDDTIRELDIRDAEEGDDGYTCGIMEPDWSHPAIYELHMDKLIFYTIDQSRKIQFSNTEDKWPAIHSRFRRKRRLRQRTLDHWILWNEDTIMKEASDGIKSMET